VRLDTPVTAKTLRVDFCPSTRRPRRFPRAQRGAAAPPAFPGARRRAAPRGLDTRRHRTQADYADTVPDVVSRAFATCRRARRVFGLFEVLQR
jgi:hypothetical protein